MIPDAEQVVVFRWKLAVWLRLAGVLVVLLSLPSFFAWAQDAIENEGLLKADYYYNTQIITGFGFVFIGVLFFRFRP